MDAEQFVAYFKAQRASAILRTSDQDAAREAMEAAVRGGFKVLEFTLSVPGALDLITEFSSRPGLVVGAGTVLTREDARACVGAGARFLVSPVVDEEVIDEANKLGVAAMPGCATPTEMLRAHRAGAQLQKLFPVAGPGPAWVLQTRGPLPFLNIVPTSGVTQENMGEYLEAGAFALGFVNSLFVPAEVLGGEFGKIEARARRVIEALSALPD
jgi:2-dehydro-3-deoxyphosphogluconate aldolase/(4S)-4-hydroxy-2-oxoglutarate aldolase